MPTNMVLRFRDLIEETINQHRKKIEEFGYVWWAWWNKPDEKVPRIFYHFKDIIKNNGCMWIYLADSGTLRLYKAKLIEIDIAEDEEVKECREIEKMPEYYFTSMYKVWFCFENIKDANPDEIREWSYDNPSDFRYVSDMESFQDKRVSSINEMISQHHRTIYFIQLYNQEQHSDFLIESASADDRDRDKFVPELEKYVDDILVLIEEINKRCDYASSEKTRSPVCIPFYLKEMEKCLKAPAQDEALFKVFSNYIYQLIVDGHKRVMSDIAIISRSEFTGLAGSLLEDIRLFRNDLHHLVTTNTKKKRLGRLYNEVCGKSVLDDSNSRMKFQLEFLKRTAKVLEKELVLVKEKINGL